MFQSMLILAVLLLGGGVFLLYRLCSTVSSIHTGTAALHAEVMAEIRKVRYYADSLHPAFPLTTLRIAKDWLDTREALVIWHENQLEKIPEWKDKARDYRPAEDVKALMRNVIEARYALAQSERDLHFMIEANLMVQRGELTIAEARSLANRTGYDELHWKAAVTEGIDSELDVWLASLTAEGKEKRLREMEDRLKNSTALPETKLDHLWKDRFQVGDGWKYQSPVRGNYKLNPNRWDDPLADAHQKWFWSGSSPENIARNFDHWSL